MMKILIISTLIALGTLSGCNYKVDKLSGENGDSTTFETDKLDFATVMSKAIEPKCMRCHSIAQEVKDGVAFDTYAQVIENLADIKSDVEDGSMPKTGPKLTTDQRAMVLAWIKAGAPEFATATPEPPTPQPPTPPVEPPTNPPVPPSVPESSLDFATVYSKVIEPLCFKCHQAPNNKGDVNLETYEEVIKNIVEIKGDIEDGSMPRKRTITAEQKALILNWIAAGAPEKAVVDSEAQAEKESMTKAMVQFLFSQKAQNSQKGN